MSSEEIFEAFINPNLYKLSIIVQARSTSYYCPLGRSLNRHYLSSFPLCSSQRCDILRKPLATCLLMFHCVKLV